MAEETRHAAATRILAGRYLWVYRNVVGPELREALRDHANVVKGASQAYEETYRALALDGDDDLSRLAPIAREIAKSYRAVLAESASFTGQALVKHYGKALRFFVQAWEGDIKDLLLPGHVADADWMVSPHDFTNVRTGEIQEARFPLRACYERSEPGARIMLSAGDHPHFRVEKPWEAGQPQTIVFADPTTPAGAVRIIANPVGGSSSIYLELAGHLTFQGRPEAPLIIAGDDLRTIGCANAESNYPPRWQKFSHVRFEHCHLDGSWDFVNNTGEKEKWGVLGHDLDNFVWHGGKVEGIKHEHCFYLHNNKGPVLIQDCELGPSGRTAVQVTARAGEGSAGVGDITLRNLLVRDPCLEQGGGGFAFTFAGRQHGDVLIEKCRVEMGLGDIHGRQTGALVAHAGDGSLNTPTQSLTVRDCHFEVGEGCEGSSCREVVQIDNVGVFRLVNTTIIQRGSRPALSVYRSVGSAYLGRECNVVGKCMLNGRLYESYQDMLDAI